VCCCRFIQFEVRKQLPRWVLPEGQTSIYGWEQPCMKHVLFVRVFNPALPDKKLCTEILMDKVMGDRQYDVIDMGKGHGKVGKTSK
jgi:hypothetical protein